MAFKFDIIEYISGLTTFVLDESILKRIAIERHVADLEYVEELDERTKDLLTADILFAVYFGPATSPSFQHQHGQFSTSTGSQNYGNKAAIRDLMLRLYRKWDDPKAEYIQGQVYFVPEID